MNRRSAIWPLLLFCFFQISAQSVDTLEQRLQTGNLTPSDSLYLLNVLSRSLTYINPTRSLQYANKALELAAKLADSSQLADAYRNLANVYSYSESFAISMDYLQRALDIFTRVNDSAGLGNCYISLGHTYRRLRQQQKEVEYHRKAYRLFSKLNIKERIGVSAHNLGESYYNSGNLDSALLLTRQAMRINREIKNYPVLSSCYKVMGLIYLNKQNYDSSEFYLNQVLKLSNDLGSYSQKEATATALLNLAEIYRLRAQPEKQITQLHTAAVFCRKHKQYSFLQEAYYQLAKATAATNPQQATEYMEQYRQVTDSIRSNRLTDWQNLLQTAANVYQLNKQNQVLAKTSQQQKRQIKVLYFILIIISVSVFVILIAVKRIMQLQTMLSHQLKIIEEQKRKLEELNATKDRFFSIVSHDLRSPLNSLSGFLKLIKDHGLKLSREELLQMIHQLEDRLTNTTQLTDNLLTWARVQMGSYYRKPEKLALKELVSNSCSVYKHVAHAKNISVSCLIDDDLIVYADRNQVAFAVRNLINNAIKFTPPGGAVKVEAVKREAGKKIQLTIGDTGVGIPPENIPLLFRSGDKKISTPGTAGEKGTGLGLMLSYEFLRLNNATIEVKSEPGKGTEFTLLLPAPDGIDPTAQVSATEA